MQKQTGFVAGTLIHTDQGLVPIEQLKVGDMLFSKQENNSNGELSYQPITKTHRFEHQSLYMFHIVELFSGNSSSKISQIFTTPNHLFWKENVGWVRADLLKNDDKILLNNGRKVNVFGGSPVLRTKNLKTGWVFSSFEACGQINGMNNGYLIDFSNNRIVTPFDDYEQWLNADVDYWGCVADDLTGNQLSDYAYSDTVYNITVENTYTYFVGEQGIWVCYWI